MSLAMSLAMVPAMALAMMGALASPAEAAEDWQLYPEANGPDTMLASTGEGDRLFGVYCAAAGHQPMITIGRALVGNPADPEVLTVSIDRTSATTFPAPQSNEALFWAPLDPRHNLLWGLLEGREARVNADGSTPSLISLIGARESIRAVLLLCDGSAAAAQTGQPQTEKQASSGTPILQADGLTASVPEDWCADTARVTIRSQSESDLASDNYARHLGGLLATLFNACHRAKEIEVTDRLEAESALRRTTYRGGDRWRSVQAALPATSRTAATPGSQADAAEAAPPQPHPMVPRDGTTFPAYPPLQQESAKNRPTVQLDGGTFYSSSSNSVDRPSFYLGWSNFHNGPVLDVRFYFFEVLGDGGLRLLTSNADRPFFLDSGNYRSFRPESDRPFDRAVLCWEHDALDGEDRIFEVLPFQAERDPHSRIIWKYHKERPTQPRSTTMANPCMELLAG